MVGLQLALKSVCPRFNCLAGLRETTTFPGISSSKMSIDNSTTTLQSENSIVASALLEISFHACFTNILHKTNPENLCKSYCNLYCMKLAILRSQKPVLCVNCGLQFYQNVNKDLL